MGIPPACQRGPGRRRAAGARIAHRPGGRDQDGFLWDDGQPWQLYVEEADGTRTYVYHRWVQLGTVEAHVASRAPGEKGLDLLIVENTPGELRVYEVAYAGPGRVTAVERLARRIHPEQGFAAAHR